MFDVQDFLRTGCDLEVSLKDLRLLLPTLSLDAAAIAGQAVALSQWHQVGGTPEIRGIRRGRGRVQERTPDLQLCDSIRFNSFSKKLWSESLHCVQCSGM